MSKMPSPETMLVYASILEKPQYNVVNGKKFLIPTGEIIEAACAALRYCATEALALRSIKPQPQADVGTQSKPQEGGK